MQNFRGYPTPKLLRPLPDALPQRRSILHQFLVHERPGIDVWRKGRLILLEVLEKLQHGRLTLPLPLHVQRDDHWKVSGLKLNNDKRQFTTLDFLYNLLVKQGLPEI